MSETILPTQVEIEAAVKKNLQYFLSMGHSGGRFDIEVNGMTFTVKVHNKSAKLAFPKDETLPFRPFYQLR